MEDITLPTSLMLTPLQHQGFIGILPILLILHGRVAGQFLY